MLENIPQGLLISRKSREVGYNRLCSRVAFPSKGSFHCEFEVKRFGTGDFLLGITDCKEDYGPKTKMEYFKIGTSYIELLSEGKTE